MNIMNTGRRIVASSPTMQKAIKKGGKLAGKAVYNALETKMGSTAARIVVELAGAALPHAKQVGVSLAHGLGHKNESSVFEKAPLTGSVVESNAAAATTETKYISEVKSRLSASTVAALKMGQRINLEVESTYQLGCAAQLQGVGDMSTPFITAVLPIAIWQGDYANATTSTPSNRGVFSTLLQMGAQSLTSSKMYFQECNTETIISNASQQATFVDIYELVAKVDVGNIFGSQVYAYSPARFWSTGLTSYVTSTPATLPAGAFTTAAALTEPAQKPWGSPLFNCYWDVASRYTVNLSLGAVHRHMSTYKINSAIPYPRYNNSLLLGGITRSIMIVIRGQPGFDTFINKVVSAPSAVNVQHISNYSACNIVSSQKIMYYSRNEVGANSTDTVNVTTVSGEVSATP